MYSRKENETIKPFFGEFFINPCPLELSGTYCSHNCAYCFSNLNNRYRRLALKRTLKLIQEYPIRRSLEAKLLQEKYPVVISNHVDPFSSSNYKDMLPIMEALTREEIPIAIQTKGGNGIEEALKFLPPSCWYISIAHDNEQTRNAVEWASPSIESRLQLITTLKKHNHKVLIGINPIVPDWIKSPLTFISNLADLNIDGIWFEPLHLNYKQRNNLSKKAKEALGDELIKTSMKRKLDTKHQEFFENCRAIATELEIPIYSVGQHNFSNFFKAYTDVYPKTFPVIQDWVNHCHNNKIEVFNFKEWSEFFNSRLPKFEHNQLYHYIECYTQRIQFDFEIPKNLTYQDLLFYSWKSHKFKRANPIHCRAFAYTGTEDDDGLFHQWIDQNSLPLFSFCPQGTDEMFIELAQEVTNHGF